MIEEHNTNQLPKDWKWVKLKDISESIQYGYTESSSKEVIGPKFLRITDIQDNKVFWNEVPYCKIDEETKKKYLLKDGDLVFARTGATVGKSFLLKGSIPESVFASYLIRVRVNREINEKYLSNFFHSTFYWSQITEGQVGIGQPNVNGTKLGQLDLPLPPKPTQYTIVFKIEKLFSELDKGIEQLKTAQQQLKTYRQAVLKWAFEAKLTNENVKDDELPKEWKWTKISEIAKIETGTTPSKANAAFYGNEIPFYKPTDLEAGENVFKSSDGLTKLGIQAARYVPENSTLVTCIGATIGKTGLIKKGGGFNQQINAIVPHKNMNPKFIYYQTIGLDFQKQILKNASATTLPIINKGKFQILEMVVCSVDEQNKIVQEIESRLSVADKMEESISQSLQQAEALRQSILKKAFEGRLV